MKSANSSSSRPAPSISSIISPTAVSMVSGSPVRLILAWLKASFAKLQVPSTVAANAGCTNPTRKWVQVRSASIRRSHAPLDNSIVSSSSRTLAVPAGRFSESFCL